MPPRSKNPPDAGAIDSGAAMAIPLNGSAAAETGSEAAMPMAPAPVVPVVNKPRRGGSYIVDPNTGALTAGDQPKKEK